MRFPYNGSSVVGNPNMCHLKGYINSVISVKATIGHVLLIPALRIFTLAGVEFFESTF